MVRELNSKGVLKKVADGDKDAFTSFFHLHWDQVYGTCLHMTKSHELALDLSQEIFIKIWENRHKLPEVRNAAAYIYTISRNTIVDYLRIKVFSEENLDKLLHFFIDEGQDPLGQLEFRELQVSLQTAVDSLKGKVKLVFLLSRQEGLTHEQIAARLGISITSSKTYIVRALQEIRIFMARNTSNTLSILPAILFIIAIRKEF